MSRQLSLFLLLLMPAVGNLLADNAKSLLIAKSIIATQLEVAVDSFGDHKPISEIGVGADQMDVICILGITENTIRQKIMDKQVRWIMGKFDRDQARRMTAARLAMLITVLNNSE